MIDIIVPIVTGISMCATSYGEPALPWHFVNWLGGATFGVGLMKLARYRVGNAD